MMCAIVMLILTLAQAHQPVHSLVQKAQSDFQAGNYGEARGLLLQALKGDSQNPALWRYLALTDARLNQVDQAIADFQKALHLEPRNAQNYFGLGLLDLLKGNSGQALAMYRKGLSLDPDDLAANQHYASLLMSAGRDGEALQPLQKWAQIDCRDPAVHIALIQCYVKSKMTQAGDLEIHKFLALRNLPTAQQLELAKSLEEDKEPSLEAEVLRHITKVSPHSAEAHAMLGAELANQHRFPEAGQELWDAVKQSPDSPQYSMEFAGTLLLWKRYPAALKFLTLVKDRFGKLPEYQYKLGLAYFGLSEYPQAIATLQPLAQQHPNLEMVQYSLGNCYYSEGEFSKAERHYQRAIQLNPRNALFYGAMGQLLRKESPPRFDEAILNLEKALQLDPSRTQARFRLALCFEDQREFAKAVPLLQQVVREQPNLLAAHIALARTYYRLKRIPEGDREKAIVTRLQNQTLGKSPQ
ncbi:MAG: tetratricopeptide repeat protein [Terriglobia bacterium]